MSKKSWFASAKDEAILALRMLRRTIARLGARTLNAKPPAVAGRGFLQSDDRAG
jgi:hypothetical protein